MSIFDFPFPSTIERLESRIAPAIITGQVITYNDVDGALVHIKASSGTLEAVVVNSPDAQHQQLTTLFATAAPGANITVTVGKAATGDGLVNFGVLDASGVNLGTVTIPGDVGSILCGSGSATVPAIKSLTVHSLGALGTTTGSGTNGNGTLESDFEGSVGAMHILGDVDGAFVNVSGALHSLTIGGSIIGGSTINAGAVQAGGFLGTVKIGGNVEGGTDMGAGSIVGQAGIGSITLGGSLDGNTGTTSGYILNNSGDGLGLVTIKGDVNGGNGPFSGTINSFGPIAGISVGGSLEGGSGAVSGTLIMQAGSTNAFGPVRIAHDLSGGSANDAGSILSSGSLGAVTIGGSLLGNGHNGSTDIGTILSGGSMGKISIAGSLEFGPGNAGLINSGGTLAGVKVGGFATGSIDAGGNTGAVAIGGYFGGDVSINAGGLASLLVKGSMGGGNFSNIAGNIGSVTIDGSFGGTGQIGSTNGSIGPIFVGGSLSLGSDFTAHGDIASVKIVHDMVSGGQVSSTGGNIGNVSVGGDLNDAVIYAAKGNIGNVSVTGSVISSEIAADVFTPTNEPVKIGSIKVGGDWIASSVSAGFQGKNSVNYGNDTDTLLAPSSSIASIIIRGQIIGDTTPSDHFGFDATSLGHLQVGTNVIKLSGVAEDIAFSPLTADDVVVHLT